MLNQLWSEVIYGNLIMLSVAKLSETHFKAHTYASYTLLTL